MDNFINNNHDHHHVADNEDHHDVGPTKISSKDDQLEKLRQQKADEERELQRELASAIERLAPLDEIRILLACGARVDGIVNQGLKPIHYAVYNNFLPAVKLLILRGCNINAMDDNGYTPIHWAAERGFYELLEFLIENKAQVCFNENRKLRTVSMVAEEPLFLALKQNHLDCARLLLENGADPNTRYFMGHQINLISIVRYDQIELLLKFGADPNARDRTGVTPLMVAARHPQGFKTVELLIDYGADVNAYASERHDYRTVLHHSIFSGNVDLIKLLLVNGANYPDMEPVDKPSPLDIAIISGRHDIVRLLTEFKADTNSCSNTTIGQPLHTALTQRVENKYEIVKILLDAGADVNSNHTSNRNTGPPLHDYLHSSRLNANSSPTASSRNNHLMSIARGPDIKMVRLLLMYGAQVELRARTRTPARQEPNDNFGADQAGPMATSGLPRFGLARLLERIQDELGLELLQLLIDAAECIELIPLSRVVYNCLRLVNRPYTNELFDPSVANEMTPSKLRKLIETTDLAKHLTSAFKADLLKLFPSSDGGQDEAKWVVPSLKQLSRNQIRRQSMSNVRRGADSIKFMGELPIPFVLKRYLFFQE